MRFKPPEIVAMTAAGIACVGAVVSAMVPALYTHTSRNRELDIKLVEIGIGILRADPKEAQTNGAREWAIKVIEKHSGEPFSSEAKQELLQRKLDFGVFDFGGGGFYDGPDEKAPPSRPAAPQTQRQPP